MHANAYTHARNSMLTRTRSRITCLCTHSYAHVRERGRWQVWWQARPIARTHARRSTRAHTPQHTRTRVHAHTHARTHAQEERGRGGGEERRGEGERGGKKARIPSVPSVLRVRTVFREFREFRAQERVATSARGVHLCDFERAKMCLQPFKCVSLHVLSLCLCKQQGWGVYALCFCGRCILCTLQYI